MAAPGAEGFEFHDRYSAMGIPLPDLATMCDGDCEGTGTVPIDGPCPEAGAYATLWDEAHRRCSVWGRARQFFKFGKARRYGWRTHLGVVFDRCDGWHFVKCPACKGTGRRA